MTNTETLEEALPTDSKAIVLLADATKIIRGAGDLFYVTPYTGGGYIFSFKEFDEEKDSVRVQDVLVTEVVDGLSFQMIRNGDLEEYDAFYPENYTPELMADAIKRMLQQSQKNLMTTRPMTTTAPTAPTEVQTVTFECLICHSTLQVRDQAIMQGPWCCMSPMLAVRA